MKKTKIGAGVRKAQREILNKVRVINLTPRTCKRRICETKFFPKVAWQRYCDAACSSSARVENHWRRRLGVDGSA